MCKVSRRRRGMKGKRQGIEVCRRLERERGRKGDEDTVVTWMKTETESKEREEKLQCLREEMIPRGVGETEGREKDARGGKEKESSAQSKQRNGEVSSSESVWIQTSGFGGR